MNNEVLYRMLFCISVSDYLEPILTIEIRKHCNTSEIRNHFCEKPILEQIKLVYYNALKIMFERKKLSRNFITITLY